MASKEGKYNIKAICTKLGIQAGTLRAWERRYKIIEPIRNTAGHRLYSEEHAATLRWLIDKVNKGFTIGQAVDLYEKEKIPQKIDHLHYVDYSNELSDEILEALLSFEENRATLLLNQAFSLFSIDKVTMDILGSMVKKLIKLEESGKIYTAQERFVTSYLRTKMGAVLHGLPVDGRLPKVIAVCGPNESHELGLLLYTLFLRRKGFDVIYLGAGIPIPDVEFVLREVNATMFFTTCTISKNLEAALKCIDHIKETFPTLLIGACGFAFDGMAEEKKELYQHHLIGQSIVEWDDWIKKQFHT